MNRKLLLASSLLLAASACHESGPSGTAAAPLKLPPATVAASTTAAQQSSAPSRWFEVSGTAQAARTSRLSTKAGGILRSIKAREGDTVRFDSPGGLRELDIVEVRYE